MSTDTTTVATTLREETVLVLDPASHISARQQASVHMQAVYLRAALRGLLDKPGCRVLVLDEAMDVQVTLRNGSQAVQL